MIIYRIINKVNGKSYIGCTALTLGERKHKHWLNLNDKTKHKGRAIYLAMSKYGWDKFEWQELCSSLIKEDLPELEKFFIKEYDTYNKGYNNTEGGEGVLQPKKLERYIVRFPDDEVRVVTGYKKFCREHKLNEGNLWQTYQPFKRTYSIKGKHYTYWKRNKTCKGYTLLGKFNDYLGTEYLQAEGSGGLQADTDTCLDDDIVSSIEQSIADLDKERLGRVKV